MNYLVSRGKQEQYHEKDKFPARARIPSDTNVEGGYAAHTVNRNDPKWSFSTSGSLETTRHNGTGDRYLTLIVIDYAIRGTDKLQPTSVNFL